MEINLSDWASLVQDVAAGLQALPPGLSNCLDPEVVTLLQQLEAVTQVRLCCLCYHPDTNCRCAGVPPSTPLTSWSQITEQTPGYRTTASASGVTTPSTSLGGMSGLVLPPPGISIWDMFPWKTPIPKQPVTTPSYRPPIGRGEWLKATLSMSGLVPQVPQIAPAICQLPPLPRGRPATPYQQVVQPPSKTSGLRVTFDSPASKPAPTGSRDIDVRGRWVSRGRDDDSQAASCPRGGRKGSSIRETSNWMPRQEGGCPTGVPHNIPPSSTPGKPPPQPGGITKASPRNPLKNLANYRSTGWRKDLDHILGSFYHYNYPSRKEEEWKKLRTKFFKYLGQHQEEWRTIKEDKALQYMPYMEHHFQALTGVRLKGLSQFTGWIKPGSYYHGVVARKGQLHMCLHLAGTKLPKGLQIRPSQSHPVTQKEEETPTTSPPTPGREGSTPQGARSDPSVPNETGGAGDGQSWAEQAEASADEEWRRGRPAKHRWSTSRKREDRSTVRQYSSSTGMQVSSHRPVTMWLPREWLTITLTLGAGQAKSLNNQVLCMILEYHLTCLSRGSSCISPVLPEAAKDLLPPVEEYLASDSFQGTRDVRVLEKAKTLRVAVWLHRLDIATAGDEMTSLFLDVTQYSRGPLLEFLLAPQTSSLIFEKVIQRVLAENHYRTESLLDDIQKLWARLQRELEDLSQAHKVELAKSPRKKIKRDIERRRKDLKDLEATISQYETSLGRAWVQPGETPASEDDPSNSGAKGAMATTPVADDAPPVSATPEPLTSPPGEEQTRSMEVDDRDDRQPPV